MSRAHLAVDVRESAIYWVRARAGRRGLTPVACGALARKGDVSADSQLRELAASRLARRVLVETSLRVPELVQQRETLPTLRPREMDQVGCRRAAAVAAELELESCAAHERSPRTGGPLWLCAAPLGAVEEAVDHWKHCGFELHRISSSHLALGNLARLLEPAEDELVAIFDLEAEVGTCVVADRDGWVFSREVPLRLTRDLSLRAPTDGRQPAGSQPSAPDPTCAEALEPSGLELAAKEESEPYLDPLEVVADHAERLATELQRTLRYVEGDLRLGRVASAYLAGESRQLRVLAESLGGTLGIPVLPLCEGLADTRLADIATGGAVALGLALAPSRSGGNLLPAATLQKRAVATARRRLLVIFGATLALLAAAGIALGLRVHAAGGEARAVARELERNEQRRDWVGRIQRSRRDAAALAAALESVDGDRPPWAALLATLARVAPPDAFVERLRAHRGDNAWHLALWVEAAGSSVSDAARSISELARAADASPLIAVDATEREEAPPANDPEGGARVRFRIEGRLASVERAVDRAGSATP